ncbi:MAG: serine/threonine-protein kinase, partial [Pyrinomonadaceae bacterium]
NFLSDPVFEVGAQVIASELDGILGDPTFGSYELLRLLGRGGAGLIFLARDRELERMAALKVLPAYLSDGDDRILRFRQEAQAASSISHPNVTSVYGFGKANGRHYIAMEYVRGQTLRELLKAGDLNLLDALDFAIQAARALTAAHDLGIIHRDVKPENLIIRDDRMLKVLDFGLAKQILQSDLQIDHQLRTPSLVTETGHIMGTTSYMSPEQIRGKDLDLRTDIWSLGVVLYEMLAGARPFVGETPSDTQAQILLSDPPPTPVFKAYPELMRILNKMLDKDRLLRYDFAGTIIDDLEIVYREAQKRGENRQLSRFNGQSIKGPGMWTKIKGLFTSDSAGV